MPEAPHAKFMLLRVKYEYVVLRNSTKTHENVWPRVMRCTYSFNNCAEFIMNIIICTCAMRLFALAYEINSVKIKSMRTERITFMVPSTHERPT